MEQAELLQFVIERLESLELPYMVVGSFASGAYGEPRLTQDIDIVIDLQPDQVDRLCDAFPSEQFYVSREAALQAVAGRGQFNVIDPDSANKIDFMIARDDEWGREQLARRWRVQLLPHHQAFAARPEDIIISKMLYYQEGGSEKHLRDIAGMVRVSGQQIDPGYVERWAQRLNLLEIWQAVKARLAQNK